jgi:hypothetical protein
MGTNLGINIGVLWAVQVAGDHTVPVAIQQVLALQKSR